MIEPVIKKTCKNSIRPGPDKYDKADSTVRPYSKWSDKSV